MCELGSVVNCTLTWVRGSRENLWWMSWLTQVMHIPNVHFRDYRRLEGWKPGQLLGHRYKTYKESNLG